MPRSLSPYIVFLTVAILNCLAQMSVCRQSDMRRYLECQDDIDIVEL